MPDRTTYTVKAVSESSPYSSRETGMDTASILCKILSSTRLPVSGKDRYSNSAEDEMNFEKEKDDLHI